MKRRRKISIEPCACGCLRTVPEAEAGDAIPVIPRKEGLFAAVPVVVLLGFTAIAWSLPHIAETEEAVPASHSERADGRRQ